MSKTFLQIFEKYKPSDVYAEILKKADNIKIQADKANRMLNASVDFPMLVTKMSFMILRKALPRHISLI